MHLIYTRFWNKVMRDMGLVNFNEPVKCLLTQGMVTNRVEGTDEFKAMSKSLGNGVDPDDMIEAFGADATRLFVLFAAPVENELRWSETGIEGAVRFLRRVWTMVYKWRERLSRPARSEPSEVECSPEGRALRRKTYQTIAKVTSDFDGLHLNTSVAALMEFFNQVVDFNADPVMAPPEDVFVMHEALEALVVMLAPFSPHIAEEMWEGLGQQGGLLKAAPWPIADSDLAKKEELEIPVQVNGKVRGRMNLPPGLPNDVVDEAAILSAVHDENIAKWLVNQPKPKRIIVPDRLVNMVVSKSPVPSGQLNQQAFEHLCEEALADLPSDFIGFPNDEEWKRREALQHLYAKLKAFVGSSEVPLLRPTASEYENLKRCIAMYAFHHSSTFIRTEPIVEMYVAKALKDDKAEDGRL
jgi:leucyl-tRNA synthetase